MARNLVLFERLIAAGRLMGYKHEGFWRAGRPQGSAGAGGDGGTGRRAVATRSGSSLKP
jgi:hypothetical protein